MDNRQFSEGSMGTLRQINGWHIYDRRDSPSQTLWFSPKLDPPFSPFDHPQLPHRWRWIQLDSDGSVPPFRRLAECSPGEVDVLLGFIVYLCFFLNMTSWHWRHIPCMYGCMHACMHACVYIPWYNHINIYICVNIYVYIQYTCIHPAESSWPSPSPSSTCLFFQGHPPLGWYLDCMDGWCPERSNPRAGVHQWEAGDAAVVTNLFRLIGSTVFC